MLNRIGTLLASLFGWGQNLYTAAMFSCCTAASSRIERVFALVLIFLTATYGFLVFELTLLPWKYLWLTPLLIVINVFLIALLYARLDRCCQREAKNDRYLRVKAVAVGIVALIINLINLKRKGLMRSPDTADQWNQVMTGVFEDWHPVIHTFTIWFFSRIYANEYFVLSMFVLLFAVVCSWLYYTLCSCGCSRWAVLAVMMCIIFSPVTMFALRVLWKDSAFMIAILALTTGAINVYCSGGRWLKKTLHTLLFALLVFYCSFGRHNGIFFTVPMLFMLCMPTRNIACGMKRYLRCFAAIMAVVLIVYIIVRSMLINAQIIQPSKSPQGFAESVGLLMSMMAEVYVKAPEKMPPDAAALLAEQAPREQWLKHYRGNFNSVKFTMLSGHFLRGVSPERFLKAFLGVAQAAPGECMHSFLHVTAVAWDPYWNHFQDMEWIWSLEHHLPWVHLLRIGWIWTAVGLYFFLLLFVGVYALLRKGWGSLFLILPFLCYTTGTALLLSGWDHRFFWGVIIGSMPLLIIFAAAEKIAPAASRNQTAQENSPR